MRPWIAAALVTLLWTAVSPARDLPLPAEKGWKHAETGLILTAQLAGLPRTRLTDATETEHDVAAEFEDPSQGLFATVYLFHPAIADVSLWFDRSSATLADRNIFREASPASMDPIAFAAPGSTTASSLRQSYSILSSPIRSTELAVMPLGDWIVAVRLSSKLLTADALDARLQQLIGAIGWPAPKGASAPVAVPTKTCASPPAYTRAKVKKAQGADVLVSLMTATLASEEKTKASAEHQVWCRDGEGTAQYGVYRSDPQATAYVLAIADAGRVVNVAPSLMGLTGKNGGYTVSFANVDGSVDAFPSFASLPEPAQVFELVVAGQSSGTSKGNAITIDAKVLQ